MRPHAVCLDFELALINCVKRAFPNARLSACYFHLAQVVIRHLTGGLKAAYETELEFGIEVRMILALAFVPGEKLIAYLNALKQVIDARLTPLLEYFEDTYIGWLCTELSISYEYVFRKAQDGASGWPWKAAVQSRSCPATLPAFHVAAAPAFHRWR